MPRMDSHYYVSRADMHSRQNSDQDHDFEPDREEVRSFANAASNFWNHVILTEPEAFERIFSSPQAKTMKEWLTRFSDDYEL